MNTFDNMTTTPATPLAVDCSTVIGAALRGGDRRTA